MDASVTIAALHIYPVKSCAGISVAETRVDKTGFALDRDWMLVDADGEFVSQRELPRMALVATELRHDELVLHAPGMRTLSLSLGAVERPTQVRVWSDTVAAHDMGMPAATWFSDVLGQSLRLVRFDPTQQRFSDRAWTGGLAAENAFSDGFPILVLSTASLAGLNTRLTAAGIAPVTMARFRPNLVLDGLDAHGEDFLDEIVFDSANGPIRLKLVKPCPRCPIPNVDPATGVSGTEPGDTLASYRADARVQGAISFGMNAIVLDGIDRVLRVGQSGQASLRF